MADAWLPEVRVHASGAARFETELLVAENLLWFSGHFPGQPLLPGLGMLAFVLHTLRLGLGAEDLRLTRILKLRFKGLVHPGDRLAIVVELKSGDPLRTNVELQARFQIRSNAGEIGGGRMVLKRPVSAQG